MMARLARLVRTAERRGQSCVDVGVDEDEDEVRCGWWERGEGERLARYGGGRERGC